MKHNVFETVTDQNTAYWLGFLAADGCCPHKQKDQIMIGLAAKDRNHLEKFANFIDYPISLIVDYDSKCSNGNFYPSAKIMVTSAQIRADLEQYGIIVAKSNQNIDFLSYIPEEYKLAFIFGYFDGDGWFVNAQSYGFGFCGNELTMKSIALYLQEHYQITFNSVNAYIKSPNTYYFQTQSSEKTLSFIKLYLSFENNCDLLERKKQVAYDLLERLQNKIFVSDKAEKEHGFEDKKIPLLKTCLLCGCNYETFHAEQKYCSQVCAHKAQQHTDRPSREELKELIRTSSFLQIGRIYNVSDNAIRKWCKAANLPSKATEIKQYSDEEWEKI